MCTTKLGSNCQLLGTCGTRAACCPVPCACRRGCWGARAPVKLVRGTSLCSNPRERQSCASENCGTPHICSAVRSRLRGRRHWQRQADPSVAASVRAALLLHRRMARVPGQCCEALRPNDAVAFFACAPSRGAGVPGSSRFERADCRDPVDALVTDAEFDTLSRVGEGLTGLGCLQSLLLESLGAQGVGASGHHSLKEAARHGAELQAPGEFGSCKTARLLFAPPRTPMGDFPAIPSVPQA